MNHCRLLFLLVLCEMGGCSLPDPMDISMSCPEAKYYVNASGNIDGHFDDVKDPYYALFSEMHYCPRAYPVCSNDASFCHESCRQNEVFCSDQCINSDSHMTYCGAKGLCLDDDPESENYRGQTCRSDQRCEKGKCVCNGNEGECGCPDNAHAYEDNCEEDSLDHCGAHDHPCQLSQFPHAGSIECKDKACVVKSCAEGAFFTADGKSCTTCQDLIDEIKKQLPEDIQDNDPVYITFGHYKQLHQTEEKQPIEWQVLDVNSNGDILLLSRFVLEARKFNTKHEDISWDKSTIRSWLNGLGVSDNKAGEDYSEDSFIKTAFNEEEMKCIQTVTNDASVNSETGVPAGGQTTDRIFLLGIKEINEKYLKNQEKRIAYGTVYAKADTLLTSGTENIDVNYGDYHTVLYSAYWWLRTPGIGADYSTYITSAGTYINSGDLVTRESMGVRPAMWLKK